MPDYTRPVFKAAAVQAMPVLRDAPVYIDGPATLEKACQLVKEAGAHGARLVVFPEGFLPTFPYWSISVDQPYEWTVLWKEYLKNSIEVPGPQTEALCRAAREADSYVVIGINERDKTYGGRMYNASLFISPVDGVMGVHRKVNPTLAELLYHTRGDGGDNIKVYKSELGNLGSLICGEHTQYPLIYNLVAQGLEISCSHWPGSRGWGKGKPGSFSLDTEIQVMTRSLCIASGVFAVSASCCIPEGLKPMNFYPNASFERRGGSSIVDPMGEYVAEPVYDIETIVYGDIDLGRIAQMKSIRNLLGIYGRWDLFSLATRQKPYQPLMPLEQRAGEAEESDRERIRELEDRIRSLESQIQRLR